MEWLGNTPWDHQKIGVAKAVEAGAYGFWWEMGTGKSYGAINVMRQLFAKERRVLRTLILTPPIVIENWRREIGKYSKIEMPRVIPLVGDGTKRLEKFQALTSGDKQKGFVFITNYETLLMDPFWQAIRKWKPEMLILDESHKCKDTKSKRTKKAIALADMSKYRLLLSGSPILNDAMDIFAQFKIIDASTFGRVFSQFKVNYFYDKNAGMPKNQHFPDWQPRPDTYERLHIKINRRSMAVKKLDCLTLPPVVRKEVFVELAPAQRKAYDEMLRDFLTFIDGNACVASLAMTKALRLMQIVSGFAAVEVVSAEGTTRKAVKFKDDPRAVALRDLLAEISTHSKCLVWAVHRENYQTIRDVCDSLGLGFVEVHGDVTAKAKQEAIDRLNTDDTVKVLIGHPGSGGIGVNLVAASYSIFYSRGFSLEHDLQARARNDRAGNEMHAKITHIDIVATGTIDEQVTKKLAAKIAISDEILLAIRKEL